MLYDLETSGLASVVTVWVATAEEKVGVSLCEAWIDLKRSLFDLTKVVLWKKRGMKVSRRMSAALELQPNVQSAPGSMRARRRRDQIRGS